MILASAGGETKRIIEDADCGVCVDSGDDVAFSKVIEECARGDYNVMKFGANALAFYIKHFSKDVLLNELEKTNIQ